MGRKSRRMQAAAQADEARRVLALAAIPPAPGETARRLPTVRTDAPTWAQPEFLAWFNASQAKREDGSWADGLDGGAAGQRVLAETRGREVAATYTNSVAPPQELVSPAAAWDTTGPDDWSAPDLYAERTTTRAIGDPGPAAQLLDDQGEAVASGGGWSLPMIGLALGGIYLAWRVYGGR